MPRGSVIRHIPGSVFIKIESDFASLFPGDPCASELLSVFEEKVNDEIAGNDSLSKDPDLVWFPGSISNFEYDLLLRYKPEQISNSIQTLEATGFIDSQPFEYGGPTERLYRLFSSRVNFAIRDIHDKKIEERRAKEAAFRKELHV